METRVQPVIGAIVWTLMLAGAPAAQSKVPGLPSGTQLNPGSVSSGGGNYIVIGCISREGQDAAETFVITDSRATPPARFRLQGDTDLLRIHVGHTDADPGIDRDFFHDRNVHVDGRQLDHA